MMRHDLAFNLYNLRVYFLYFFKFLLSQYSVGPQNAEAIFVKNEDCYPSVFILQSI